MIQAMVNHLYHEVKVFLPEVAYGSIERIRSAFSAGQSDKIPPCNRQQACSQHLLTLVDNEFLQARAYRVAATVLTCSGPGFEDLAAQVAVQTLDECATEDSQLIQTICIRATLDYNRYVLQPVIFEIQAKTIAAISKLLDAQDVEDLVDEGEFLCDTLLEALRDAIAPAPRASLQYNTLQILFKLLRYSPYDTVTYDLSDGAFRNLAEDISRAGKDDYHRFCIHVLPMLLESINIALSERHESWAECVLSMLEQLAKNSPAGLPMEFITSAMPSLCRIIFSDAEEATFLHQRATSIIQLMISHEPMLVFTWQDPEIHKSGLELTTLVIERLLGPQADDHSAAEVGSLAIQLVEKADADTVRSLIPVLLTASATRLLTTKYDPLVQSLSLLFAHIALHNTAEVLDFLGSLGNGTGLETVLRKWVDSSVNFVGQEAIKTNIMALGNIYKLGDGRLTAIVVNGDLIINPAASSRIKTRSAARAEPDRYEQINLQLKILKVLIGEVPLNFSPQAPDPAALQQALASPSKSSHGIAGSDDEDDDDGWSDASEGSYAAAVARQSHRHSFVETGGSFFSASARDNDRGVLDVLLDFFVSVAGDVAFQGQIGGLNEGEQARLRALDELVRARQGFSLGA